MKVLHIEDRRENRSLVRKVLESSGITVIDAHDGCMGISLAQSVEPDLILVDINIPGLDGYEVAVKLKGIARLDDVPLVAVTAEGDRERALALGFDGFITKPIQTVTFAATLRAFTAGRRDPIEASARERHLVDHSRRVVDRLEDKGRELFSKQDTKKRIEDLSTAVSVLKARPEFAGKWGSVGFCFGGGIVNLFATRFPDMSAGVAYYGVQPAASSVPNIKAAIMIHNASDDARINDGHPAYEEAMKANKVRYEHHSYPKTQHGFHNDTTPRYDDAAANLSWQRTVDFFNKHLR